MAKVFNINGTSDNTCNCTSWLEHWKKFSRESADYCSEKSCLAQKEIVGAHVQKVTPSDNHWYIIPLCKAHNAIVEDLVIMDSRILVSGNVAETCGKVE